MRSLVFATVSAVALGLAVPGYAQSDAGTANPATAAPAPTTPANPATMPATPQSGTDTQSTQGATNGSNPYGTSPYTANSGAMQGTGSDVRQAQERLQAEGLYRGKIDGRDGPKTRAAIRQFQKKNGLPVTARLDESTLNELTGGMNQNMGQGSSMPPAGSSTNMTPPASSGAGANGNTGTGTGTSYK